MQKPNLLEKPYKINIQILYQAKCTGTTLIPGRNAELYINNPIFLIGTIYIFIE